MEYLRTAGFYIVCVIAGLIPPALWVLGRKKYKSPLFPVVLLHITLLACFFVSRSDRFNAKGYGELVRLFLFTPYFLVYSFGLICLAWVSLRQKSSLYAAVVGISLATALFAYEANQEFDWRLPSTRGRFGRTHFHETPTKSAIISGGVTLALGLFLAANRPKKGGFPAR